MLLALLAACVSHAPGAFSAEQLAAQQTSLGPALVQYLAQPGADAGVCDRAREGPSVHAVDEPVVRALVSATVDGRVSGDVSAACTAHLLRDPAASRLTAEVLLARLPAGITRDAGNVAGLVDALVDRPHEVRLSADAVRRTVEQLSRIAGRGGLTQEGRAALAKLRRGVELDGGLVDGVPATKAAVEAEAEPARLLLMARRLQDVALAELAGTRLVELRIAGSPYALVRTEAAAVRRALAESGAFAVDLGRHPVTAARWEPGPETPTIVRLQQDAKEGRAWLVAVNAARETSLEPAVALSSALRVEVAGLDGPVPFCPPADPWDPTPCIATSALALDHPGLVLRGGDLVFRDDLVVDDVVLIGRDGERLTPELRVGGVPVAGLDFLLHFDPVDPLVLRGRGSGGPGPDLRVDVVEIGGGRLLFGVQVLGEGTKYAAVASRHDEGFAVVSQGGDGSAGSPGSMGAAGTNGNAGIAGSCPSTPGGPGGAGGPGGQGGTGGAGHAGGPGGTVTMMLDCENCESLRPIALRRGRSRGGAGGAGGAGGQGGPGHTR